MVEIKDTKIVGSVTTQPVSEYVTFWGKIKGSITKQEDLMELLEEIKKLGSGITDSFKKVLDKVSNIYIGQKQYQINNITLDDESSEYDSFESITYNISPLGNKLVPTQDISIPTKDYVDSRDSEIYYSIPVLSEDLEDGETLVHHDQLEELNYIKHDQLVAGNHLKIEESSEGDVIVTSTIEDDIVAGNGIKITTNDQGKIVISIDAEGLPSASGVNF